MGIIERIKDIEVEIARTQKNKATNSHLMRLRAQLAKLRTEVRLSLFTRLYAYLFASNTLLPLPASLLPVPTHPAHRASHVHVRPPSNLPLAPVDGSCFHSRLTMLTRSSLSSTHAPSVRPRQHTPLPRQLLSSGKSGGGGGGGGGGAMGDGNRGFEVARSGDGRVSLIGFPSVGKSSLLSKLTDTKSEAAGYEFTTLTAIPGNLYHKGCKIQLLDLPGIIEGAAYGKGRGRQVLRRTTLWWLRVWWVVECGACRCVVLAVCV